MYWYWWAWFAIVVFLILLPLTYGWGYRGWGPPYPRYYYRRRSVRDSSGRRLLDEEALRPVLVEDQPEEPEPRGWGLFADLVWLAVIGAIIWAIVAFVA